MKEGNLNVSKLYHRPNCFNTKSDFTIPSNHLANTISWFVDSIPEDVLLGDTAKTGRPAYHRAMMLRSCFLLIPEEYFQAERLN